MPQKLSHRLAPLYFLAVTLLCQCGAFAVFFIAHRSYMPLVVSGALSLLSAWLLAVLFKLPFVWKWVNVIVGPSAILYLVSGLPPSILFIPILLLVLIYLPTFWTRVPYYPTSQLMYEAIRDELPEDREFVFIDLGCGFGRLLSYLKRHRPHGTYYGVEIGPLPYLVSKIRALFSNGRIKIFAKSFWNFSLEPYQYVYAFLAPGPMPALWEKAKNEMKKGAVLMVNSFEVPATPFKVIEVPDERKCRLLLYSIK